MKNENDTDTTTTTMTFPSSTRSILDFIILTFDRCVCVCVGAWVVSRVDNELVYMYVCRCIYGSVCTTSYITYLPCPYPDTFP